MTRKRSLTLAIDEDLIVRARALAARRRTTLTELVRRSIEELVSGGEMQAQARARLKSRMRNPAMRIGKARWAREDLHNRSRLR